MDLTKLQTFRVAACDLNGQMRGKRVPGIYGEKLHKGAVRFPFSALNVDLWGDDIEDSPLVFASGDADAVLVPTSRGPVPMPWLDGAPALVPMTMTDENGTPYAGDPRQALAGVLDRYATRGWTVIAATEMEFTLVDDRGAKLAPPVNPVSGRTMAAGNVLSLAELEAFEGFFNDLYDGCTAMGIPAQTATSECGIGQFEITINHRDAMSAADDAWLFKALARGLARKHGCAATFMAKPYPNDAGNGMHVHFSVLDADGRNVFDNGGQEGTGVLLSAVAGCLAAMSASTLIFAPNSNSYARIVPGSHAPTGATWGYENRTAAVRIPGGSHVARRIEHRVAGGDINPYLMLAVVLGAALAGIEDDMSPSEPVTGNAYDVEDAPQLAATWAEAIAHFGSDRLIRRILPGELVDNLVMTKRQELDRFASIPEDQHWRSYLEAV